MSFLRIIHVPAQLNNVLSIFNMIKKIFSLNCIVYNVYNDCILKLVDGEIVYQLKVIFLGHESGKWLHHKRT